MKHLRQLLDPKVYWMCLSKRRYASSKTAEASIKRRRKRIKLRSYPCPHCEGWHVTKRS